MKVAIMQPYFMPYIGYFQLINAVDVFVIYDNIEFTKKGWINRNRILVNKKDDYFTLSLKKDSDFLNVNQRVLSETFTKDKEKIICKITELYKKSSQFDNVFPLIENIFNIDERNLFDFILHSLKVITNYLEIRTKLMVSSAVNIDHSLKSQEKVLAICAELNADSYINPIGGTALYSEEDFSKRNITLSFLQSEPIKYKQFNNEFVPWLSIIDVMMFNSKETVQHYLKAYTLL